MVRKNRCRYHRIQEDKQGLYPATLALQEAFFNEIISQKTNQQETTNHLIFCEHQPVYTLGKHGNEANLLFDPKKIKADFYKIDRGGDITYHGPGQLTIYPIFDLDALGLSVAEFVFQLEEIIITFLSEFGIAAFRVQNASGVWLQDDNMQKKICAVGLKVSRKVTMHGIALNINTLLSYYDFIVPCGLKNMGVTSMQEVLNNQLNMEEITAVLLKKITEKFSLELIA